MVRAVLMAVITVVAIPIAFVQPFWGLCIYLWLTHGRIADFMWWYQWVFRTNMLLEVSLLAGYVIFELQRSPPRLKGMGLMLLFWAWLVLASVHAYDHTVAYSKLWEYSTEFVIALLVAAMANSEKRIRVILYVIAVSVGILGAKAGLDVLISGGHYTVSGPGGMIHEENEFALGLNMAIPMLVWLARDERFAWRRWGLRAMAAGCAVGVIGTHSRSGFLGLIVASLLMLLYSRRKLLGVSVLALALVLFAFLAPREATERYETIPTAEKTDGSAIGRLQAWAAARGMARDHPILGVGLRNFVSQFPRYSRYQPRVPHNAFMALMAEAGIPAALVFYAMVFVTIFKMFWLRRRLVRRPDMARLANYCLILQVALTVYLVPVLFINRQDYDLLYHLIGLSAGLAALVQHKLGQQPIIVDRPRKISVPVWERANEPVNA